jgi:flagellar protein FlaF
MQRGDVYFQSPQVGGASARDTEILAFGLCNARLGKAHDTKSRIEALHKTHQLWSLLVRDLAADDNQLPKFLKDELIGLGFWAMRYSIAATADDLPLQPLIDVNRNIADGLRAQVQSAPATSPAAPVTTITAHA